MTAPDRLPRDVIHALLRRDPLRAVKLGAIPFSFSAGLIARRPILAAVRCAAIDDEIVGGVAVSNSGNLTVIVASRCSKGRSNIDDVTARSAALDPNAHADVFPFNSGSNKLFARLGWRRRWRVIWWRYRPA